MHLGLYKAKFWFRDFIHFMLPFCKNIDPNLISYAVVPLGFLTGVVFYFAPQFSVLYIIAIIFLFLRIILTTLDGFVAQHYAKSSEKGEIVNKYTPEICDIFLMLGIILSNPQNYLIGIFVMVVSWSISFFGMLGHMIGKGGESVGPLGQTDRVVTVMIISLFQYLSIQYHWNYDFIRPFLIWHIAAGILTIFLRLKRTVRKCDCTL